MTWYWEKVYETALLEKDQQRLGRKIEAALVVLNHLRHDIADLHEDNGEKEWIEDAFGDSQVDTKVEPKIVGRTLQSLPMMTVLYPIPQRTFTSL
jgi:hypothetical protein